METIIATINHLGYLRCRSCLEARADHPIRDERDLPTDERPVWSGEHRHSPLDPCDYCQPR